MEWWPRQRDGVRVEPVEDGLVAQSADGEAVHLLNVTAALIWELCDGTRTVDDIVFEVARRTREDPQRIRQDVTEALSMLGERGLLE
jgi:hypothetical protein